MTRPRRGAVTGQGTFRTKADAVRAYLKSREGESLSASEVAEGLGWPRWAVRNALQLLHRHGEVVCCIPGNGGAVPGRWVLGELPDGHRPARFGEVGDARRAEVRDLVLDGLDHQQMARLMRLSPRTVRCYIQQVLAEGGASSMRELQALEIERLRAENADLRARLSTP